MGKPGGQPGELLEAAQHLVGERPAPRPVVLVEEARLQLRDVDLDRAAAGTGGAGEALVQVLGDGVLERCDLGGRFLVDTGLPRSQQVGPAIR